MQSPESSSEQRRKHTHTHTLADRLLKVPQVSFDPCVTMTTTFRHPLLVAVPLWMSFGRAAALDDPQLCYVLDGILFVYGIILTALFCKIKVCNGRDEAKQKTSKKGEEGIYTGLTPRVTDTYETIGVKK